MGSKHADINAFRRGRRCDLDAPLCSKQLNGKVDMLGGAEGLDDGGWEILLVLRPALL